MIVLDTNVISEPLKPKPDQKVMRWLDNCGDGELFLTTTSLAELLFGIESMPEGKRKAGLAAALENLVATLIASRFLAFDRDAARAYGLLVKRSMSKGYSISITDAQIAAIAAVHGFKVATRDTAPFVAAGIPFINPWQA